MSLLDSFLMAFETDGLKELPDEAQRAEDGLDELANKAENAEEKVKKLDKSIIVDVQHLKKLAIQASRSIAPFILLGKAINETAKFANQALEVADAAEKAGMSLEQFQLQDGNRYAIFSKEDVNNAKEYEMVMRDIRMGTASIGSEISKMLLPALTAILKVVRNVVDFFVDHGAFIKAFFVGLAVVITALSIPAIIKMGIALWAALAPIIVPLSIAIALITALALIFEDFWKWMHGEPSVAELLFGDFEKFKQKFIEGFNNVVNFLKESFAKIAKFIEPILNALGFLLPGVGGLVAKAGAAAAKKINGSHADGLDYVPFDGYVAELHKGERVQTAEEAQDWRNGLLAAKKAVNFTANYPLNAIPQGAVSNAYNNSNATKTINIGDITIQTQATDAQGIATDLATYIKQAVISLDDGMLA